MSQENVEIVRGVYDAFARRDNAAPFAVYAPDMEVDFREGGGPDAQAVYHGHDGRPYCVSELARAFSLLRVPARGDARRRGSRTGHGLRARDRSQKRRRCETAAIGRSGPCETGRS